MSVKLSSYVWDGCAPAGLKITSVAIMARLADFSNDEGVCWPSVPTIARQIGAGESTVRTAIKDLEKDGWLSREKRRKGNRNASNIYQLNVNKLASAARTELPQPAESDTSNPDASKSVASKSVPSESSKNNRFDPSESGGDPSVTSKQDPSVTNSSSQNSSESSDKPKIDFLNRYPEAVIYSPNFQKWGSADDLKCAEWLFSRKCEVFKDLGLNAPKEPNYTEWANDVRLMVSQDGRTHKEICQFYKRVSQDEFWKKNVQCPRTLRNQWDELTLRLSGEQKVKIDAVERDSAYTRIIGSRTKPQNRIEEIAATLAGKQGIRGMSDFVGRKAWAGIWQQAADQAAKEEVTA